MRGEEIEGGGGGRDRMEDWQDGFVLLLWRVGLEGRLGVHTTYTVYTVCGVFALWVDGRMSSEEQASRMAACWQPTRRCWPRGMHARVCLSLLACLWLLAATAFAFVRACPCHAGPCRAVLCRCVVVEDSRIGMLAAKAAGMK